MDIGDQLDRLLDQPTQDREAWLQALAQRDAPLASRLRGLLGRVAEADAQGFLEQPAAFTRGASDPSEASHEPGQRVGPWRLVRPLGEGGMAEVWLAERAVGDYERQVALKLTHAGGAALRFGRERDVMAQLAHPGIARFYDAGVADGQAWIAMEYVEGQPLLEGCRGLSWRQRVGLLIELALAVQHAHARLVVHRDIKPGNVLIDAAGRPRLLDFGIARLLDDREVELTRAGASPLTLEFAAPEQLRGEPVGVACDVYALGLLGAVVFCGRSPFDAQRSQAQALMTAILQGTATAAIRLPADPAVSRSLRVDLEAILRRATAAEPAARYPTAQAFADDLQRWLEGRPVQARGLARSYVMRRLLHRHRWAVAAGGAVLLALANGLGLTLWQAGKTAEEARAAKATERFLVALFHANSLAQDDPAEAQQVTAATLLERGSQRIQTELQDAPATRLRLIETLIALDQDLALVDQVQALQAERLALWRRLHPDDEPGLVAVLIDAARAASASNTKVADAPALADEAADRLQRLGDAGQGRLGGRLALARAEIAGDDQCTAVRHAREATRLLRPHAGVEPAWLDALLAHAMSAAYCGEADEGAAPAREALRLAQAQRRLPAIQAAYEALSMVHSRAGQPGAAVENAELACRTAQAKHPPTAVPGTDVLVACSRWSSLLRDYGHLGAAVRVAEPLLARLPAAPQDPDAAATLWIDQARAQRQLGRLAEAQASIDKAGQLLDSFEAEPGQRALWLDARADILSARGAFALASAAFDQSHALHLQQHHVGTPLILPHVARRLAHELRAGHVSVARQRLAEFSVKSPGPQGSSRRHVERQVLAAQVALAAGEVAEAEALARDATAEARRYPEPGYIRDLLSQALQVQAEALRALRRVAEARPMQAEAAALVADMAR